MKKFWSRLGAGNNLVILPDSAEKLRIFAFSGSLLLWKILLNTGNHME